MSRESAQIFLIQQVINNQITEQDAMEITHDPDNLKSRIDYERRVTALEAEGMTRSDAQGIVDMEMMREG